MELENPEKFAKNFLEEFLSDSFGSKSKKEIELLIFKLILQDIGYYKNFDRYKVSRLLKISDTKVVNMYKELQLRDDSFNEEWFVDSINQLISNAKLEVQSKKILLQVGDPLLKIEIEKFFREKGFIVDYSFNKEILKLDLEGFEALLLSVLKQEDIQNILSIVNAKNEEEVKSLLKIALENFVKGASNQVGKRFLNLGFSILTNGVSGIVEFIGKYKDGVL
jgi:hypothetical protein